MPPLHTSGLGRGRGAPRRVARILGSLRHLPNGVRINSLRSVLSDTWRPLASSSDPLARRVRGQILSCSKSSRLAPESAIGRRREEEPEPVVREVSGCVADSALLRDDQVHGFGGFVNQMSHDLVRLRLNGTIDRRPGPTLAPRRDRPRVTNSHTKVHDWLLRPLLAADTPPAPREWPPSTST